MIRVVIGAAKVNDIVVVAPDSSPNVAPNKISNRPDHSRATVDFTLAPVSEGIVPRDGLVPHDGLVPGRAFYGAVRVTPGLRTLNSAVTRGLVCGVGQVPSQGQRSLRVEGPLAIHDDVTFTEMNGLPDGDYNMAVNLYTDEGVV